jgi:hypothetical protein
MSENNTLAAFREGTPAGRQKTAFEYLRERSRMAHSEGDGLLANHLSIVALDEAIKLATSKNCQLCLADLRWACIFAHYWLIDGYLLHSGIAEFLNCVPRAGATDDILQGLLRLYSRLIAEPLLLDPEDLSFLKCLQCDWMDPAGTPEDLALIEHLVELLWYRDVQGDSWGSVIRAWAGSPKLPEKCKRLLARLDRRLKLQSALTIPGPRYAAPGLGDAQKWGAEFQEAEIWIHTLHGDRPGVDAAVTRRLPLVSEDPILVRQLLDLQRFNLFYDGHQDPQAVRLTRRRLFDSPLLRFDETREQSLSAILGAIFKRNEVGQASERFAALRLAMLCEVSALRQWDFGMWLDAVSAQSNADLELARWGPKWVSFAVQGLLLAVVSMSYSRERGLVQGGLDALEFSTAQARERLIQDILSCYARQAYHAICLLGDLSDAIPENLWVETATWCRRFIEEGWNSPDKSTGGMLLPLGFWADIFPFIPASSAVWEKLAPVMEQEVRNPLKWQTDARGFFFRYFLHAPLEMAKAAGRGMLEQRHGDAVSDGYRFRILRGACECRKDLVRDLMPGLLSLAQTPVQKWLLQPRPSGDGPALEEERAAKQQLRGSLKGFVKRVSPGGVPQYPLQIDAEPYALLGWREEDSDCLALILQAIGNPDTLKSGVPCLLDVLQKLIWRGPRVFAEQAREPFVGWLGSMPLWRGADHLPQGGPLSAVNVRRNEEGVVEDALSAVAYQLRGRLGAPLDDALSRWVLECSIRSDLAAGPNLTSLSLALASSMHGSNLSSSEPDLAKPVRRQALLDACGAMLRSSWQRYRLDPASSTWIAWGLQGVNDALRGETEAGTSWVGPDPSVAASLLRGISGLLEQLVASPRPEVRSEVARTLRAFSSRVPLPENLRGCLAGLSSDSRARVRRAAVEGAGPGGCCSLDAV